MIGNDERIDPNVYPGWARERTQRSDKGRGVDEVSYNGCMGGSWMNVDHTRQRRLHIYLYVYRKVVMHADVWTITMPTSMRGTSSPWLFQNERAPSN